MKVTIETPSRLHFGLIDLNGELGRINGSLGVALNYPNWKIRYYLDEEITNEAKLTKNTFLAIDRFNNYFKTKTQDLHIEILQSIPNHIGLGSNTQFLLTLGTILAALNNIAVPPREIARAMKRGGTSGIGVAAFEKGGIILDGGHSFGPGKNTTDFLPSSVSSAPPPPVLFRHYPPNEWRFILITPKDGKGAHGKEEVSIFKESCPVPAEGVEKISRIILMKILPALVENDIKTFGEGIKDLQFKFPRFGMEKYSSGITSELFDYLEKNKNIYGYGLSSFGPTIFALMNSDEKSKLLLANLYENFKRTEFSLLSESTINNTGVQVEMK
ncbi:MAG: beta-ribofuranosylaminobenzene 5'-phosphate synthase family protein [Candidatus Thorarchaeota archaeon]